MPPRIGYDGKFLSQDMRFSSHSGYGVVARHLLREMLQCWPQERFTVYRASGAAHCRRADCDAVALRPWARNPWLRNLIAYPIALQRHPVDVLVAYTTRPAYAGCKTVLLLSDIFWLANPAWLPRHLAAPRTLATRRSVSRADRIVTPTEFSRREIMRLLGVPAEKIVVIPHGVRSEFAAPVSAETISQLRARFDIGPQYILSLNDIHPRKNLAGLVEAFGRLKARTGLRHRLVIAGRQLWDYPEFHRCVATSGFADDIRIIGYLPSQDLPALYRGADLFVYPSFYEGWGLQVHEAMIAGVPVAGADNTSLPEIAGGAADTFDPHDPEEMSRSMERILTDPAWCSELIARGSEQVRRYSWRQAAEDILALCAGLAPE